ncbi:MAG: hypothetical protein ABEH78_03790 [Haloferacaceae archaeon]
MPPSDTETEGVPLGVGAPTCPLCGSEMEVVERVGSRWWYCDGDGHSYSHVIES